jgi:hypothetical protein
VNGGALIYADRQAFSGTVTVSGGTSVAWASGDQFCSSAAGALCTWGLSATGQDQIKINGTNYYIVQNSVTPTSLTISTSAGNGTFAYSASSSGSSSITASTDLYDWFPSTHTFGPVFPGGNGTLSNQSDNFLLDNPALTWPADRQQNQQEAYDSSRGAMWLTGGVGQSRFWNDALTSGANQNNTCSGCYMTTWRLNLATKVWTALPSAHHPSTGTTEDGFTAVDTDDQIVLQAGYDGSATFRTAIYCPTDLNPTPGKLTANQTAAGCIRTNGADDWTQTVTMASGSIAMPLYLGYSNIFYVPLQSGLAYTGKFYVFGGGLRNKNIYTYSPLARKWAQVGAGGGCPMPVPSSLPETGEVGTTILANGNFFYHYFPLSPGDGSTQDWIYNPATDSCSQITTNGTGPSYLDGPAWGTSLAQDPVTGNIVAWSQGGNHIWEATLMSGCSVSPAVFGPFTVNQSPGTTFTAMGCGPNTLTWTSSGLPAGLSGCNSVGPTCSLGGSATTAATYTPTISVTDGGSNYNSITPNVVVNAAPSITTTSPLPAGTVGTPYSQQLAASGGTAPFTWTMTGSVPGLSLSGAGLLSGNPTTATGSPFSLTVTVTDANLIASSGTFLITINAGSGGGSSGPITLVQAVVSNANCNSTTATSCATPTLTATYVGDAGLYCTIAIAGTFGTPAGGGTWLPVTGSPFTIPGAQVGACWWTTFTSSVTSVSTTLSNAGAGRATWFVELATTGSGWSFDSSAFTSDTSGCSDCAAQSLTSLSGSNDAIVQIAMYLNPTAPPAGYSNLTNGGVHALADLLNTTNGTGGNWTNASGGTAVVGAIALTSTSGPISPPASYTLTVANGSGSGSYTAGTSVTITANTPPAGQSFLNWTGATVANPSASTTELTMPAAAATVTANFGTLQSAGATTNVMQSGVGVPTSSVGNNGDLYHRTDIPMIYGPKTLGVWPATYSYIVGIGCTTVYHIDKDCDGYGIGPTTITTDPNPLFGPDADDNDPTVNTSASVIANYGTINAFLTHLGYPTNRVFYIDPTHGVDASGCGTAASPCQYFSYSAIGTALNDGKGGTVLYRASTSPGLQICTGGGGCWYPHASAPSSPVVIMAYPGEAVTFLAGDSPLNGGGGSSNASTNVIFSGFSLIASTPGLGHAFTGEWLQNITLQNNEMAGWNIAVEPAAGSQNFTMNGNLFHDISEHAIYPVTANGSAGSVYSATLLNCSTWTWRANGTSYNPHFNFNTTNNIFLFVGSGGFDAVHYNGEICGGLISGNILIDGGGTAITYQDGNQNVTVSNNLIVNNSSGGITMNIYGCDNDGSPTTSGQAGTTCDPRGSWEQGVTYYPNMETNNRIINNTIWTGANGPNFTYFCQTCEPPSYGIVIADTSEGAPGERYIKNTTIQNNLIVTFNGGGNVFPNIYFEKNNSYPETDTLANNLFWNAYSGNSSADVVNIDSNSLACSAAPWYCAGATTGTYGSGSAYPGSYSFSAFQSYNTGSNTNELYGNPTFADVATGYYTHPNLYNFRLSPGSPATGAGLSAGAPAYDITGTLRPNPPSIGAYEFSAATPGSPLSACDLNMDGVVNGLDVQIAINQTVFGPCGNADLIGNGVCSVIDVQRVVVASFGGPCTTGQ